MKTFGERIRAEIMAPAQLDGRQFLALLTPAGHSLELRRHAASVIRARVQLIALLFAVLVPLGGVLDVLIFDLATALPLIGLRLICAVLFIALAWPRNTPPEQAERQARLSLLILLLVPPSFHLLTVSWLAGSASSETQQLLASLYGYLPSIVLGGLAIFPLTALESLLAALPVIALGIGGMLLGGEQLSLAAQGGSLWFMLMLLGVAIFSGMSQCHYMAALVIQATHDPLTGAYTRRSGEEALKLMLRLNQLGGKSLSLVFLDIDRFKGINDTYGHDAGDQCLKDFSATLQAALRRSDALIRWGGEEFVIVLPDTPPENVATLLARLRKSGFGTRPDGTPLTASIGIAHNGEASIDQWDTLIQLADLRMYRAKQSGRDGIVWPDGRWQALSDASHGSA